ncbi:hypothetical protein ACFVTE_14480 [Arthrobacter sp. NPDC058097]|uniref:hypothetical protein n=1 Tax=Arthrobacter sp. NPDC058097 TaxID=3346340 RepID=UPI0036D851E5
MRSTVLSRADVRSSLWEDGTLARTFGPRGTAGFRGALCFGAGRGRSATYRNPGQLIPGFRPAEAGRALGWLLRTYLQAYGPATPSNFEVGLTLGRVDIGGHA